MQFKGRAGHASGKQDAAASALHQAMRWGGRALDHVDALAHARFGGLTGLRFNIGRVEGGIKANMIAPEAELRFGFRPLPSDRARAISGPSPASLVTIERLSLHPAYHVQPFTGWSGYYGLCCHPPPHPNALRHR